MSLVLHWTHDWGGGTQKYIDELFDHENHIILNSEPFKIEDIRKLKVLHIHSTFVGKNIGWNIITLAEKLISYGRIKLILTVHDYQWLFPHCPNPTTEELESFSVPKLESENFTKLVNMCHVVFMHTENLFRRYKRFCKDLREEKITIAHPPDVLVNYENFFIPEIVSNQIRVGFLGGKAGHKGFYQFVDLARKMKNVQFHMYGDETNSEHFISHGKYKDVEIVKRLHEDGIHILLALSLSEETYCYALTRMINSGIPIVFLNRGSFTERLLGKHERFFEVEFLCDIEKRITDAIEYVKSNGPVGRYEPVSHDVIMNEKYISIYK
jgi:glycosyltransferase involved in cell wall biosynthesis